MFRYAPGRSDATAAKLAGLGFTGDEIAGMSREAKAAFLADGRPKEVQALAAMIRIATATAIAKAEPHIRAELDRAHRELHPPEPVDPARPRGYITTMRSCGSLVDTKSARSRGDRILDFVISTDDIDRDRDIVLVTGIELDEYMINPVFLWAHEFKEPPIGRAVSVELSPDRRSLLAAIKFASDERSDRIYRLYKEGHLSGVSIGFRILRAGPPDYTIFQGRPDLSPGDVNRVIYRCKLLEISGVPIPSNARALAVRS